MVKIFFIWSAVNDPGHTRFSKLKVKILHDQKIPEIGCKNSEKSEIFRGVEEPNVILLQMQI